MKCLLERIQTIIRNHWQRVETHDALPDGNGQYTAITPHTERALTFVMSNNNNVAIACIQTIEEPLRKLGHRLEFTPECIIEGNCYECDTVITAGNSYGHMTGGLDLAMVAALGVDVQRTLLHLIYDEYMGELSVGQALTVPVHEHPTVKRLIYAPTMRTPKHIPEGSDVPYLATLAALNKIDRYNRTVRTEERIRRVFLPLMGAGTGGVPPQVAVFQALEAITQYSLRRVPSELFGPGTERDRHITRTWKQL